MGKNIIIRWIQSLIGQIPSRHHYIYVILSPDKLTLHHLVKKRLSLHSQTHQVINLETEVYEGKLYNLTALTNFITHFTTKNNLTKSRAFVTLENEHVTCLSVFQLALMLAKTPLYLESISTTPVKYSEKYQTFSYTSLLKQKNLLKNFTAPRKMQLLPWLFSFLIIALLSATILSNIKKNTAKQYYATQTLLEQKQAESTPLRKQLAVFHALKKKNSELEQHITHAQDIKEKMHTHLKFLLDIAQQLPKNALLSSLSIGGKKQKNVKLTKTTHASPQKKHTSFLIEGNTNTPSAAAEYSQKLASCTSIKTCNVINVKKQETENIYHFTLAGKLS